MSTKIIHEDLPEDAIVFSEIKENDIIIYNNGSTHQLICMKEYPDYSDCECETPWGFVRLNSPCGEYQYISDTRNGSIKLAMKHNSLHVVGYQEWTKYTNTAYANACK